MRGRCCCEGFFSGAAPASGSRVLLLLSEWVARDGCDIGRAGSGDGRLAPQFLLVPELHGFVEAPMTPAWSVQA